MLAHSVADDTGLARYLPAVRGFISFCEARSYNWSTTAGLDEALAAYCGHCCYRCDMAPHMGNTLLNGIVYITPSLAGKLPTAWRAYIAWQRCHIAGEGGPEALELWAVLEADMRKHDDCESADALIVGLDGYLREQDLFSLRASDVRVAGKDEVALQLGIAERGESAKTGRNQGVRLERQEAIDVVVSRRNDREPNAKLFNTDAKHYAKAIASAAKRLNVEIGPPHSVRHTGPSFDAYTGYRTLPQIMRRGRWTADQSVNRYAKTHAYTAALERVPAHLFVQGTEILAGRVGRKARPVD